MNADAVGAPLDPTLRIFSPDPSAMRFFFKWMFAYNPGFLFGIGKPFHGFLKNSSVGDCTVSRAGAGAKGWSSIWNKSRTDWNVCRTLINIMGLIGHSFALFSYQPHTDRLVSFGYVGSSSCITGAVWLCQQLYGLISQHDRCRLHNIRLDPPSSTDCPGEIVCCETLEISP